MPYKISMINKTNDKTGDKIPMEALRLVPWYATGALSTDERAYIKEQLKKHPSLKKYIAEEQEIIDIVDEDKSLLDLSALEPTTVRLEKVLEKMENLSQDSTSDFSEELSNAEALPIDKESSQTSLGNKIRELTNSIFFGDNNSFKYASFASITVFLALLVAFISPLIKNDSGAVFHPASEKANESGKHTGTQLLVGIKTETHNTWLTDFLKRNDASLSKVPAKNGLYHINLNEKLNTDEIKSLLDQLNSQKEVIWFAGEAY